MSFFSSLHLFSFTAYLCLALYILIKNPKPLVKRLCAAFIACLAIWNFANIFIHNPYVSRQVAVMFTNIGSFGWISFSSFFLWFMLVFSGKKEVLKKRYLFLVLFTLPILLIPIQWSGFLLENYTRGIYGWKSDWVKSAWPYIFFSYYITFMGMGIYLAFDVMRKSSEVIKRKQAGIIFFSAVISLTAGTISDVLLPVMDIYVIPKIGSSFGLIWASGLIYVMARHKFLSIKPLTPISNIITTMFDCLVLLSREGNIVSVNDAALNLLGYKAEELIDRHVGVLIEENKAKTDLVNKIAGHENVRNLDLDFKSKKGKKIPVTFSSSLMLDEEGSVEKIVCVARDITLLKRNEAVKDVLFNISEAVRRAVTLRELLEIIQEQVGKLMDARNFYVALVYDKERALYRFPFIIDINPEELEDPGTPVELRNSFTDYVLRTEKPLLADKKKYDKLLSQEEIYLIGKKPMSWMGIPLKTAEDEVIGVVVIQSYSDESAYSQSDVDVLSIISNTIAGAIKYKQAEEALRESEEHHRTLIDNIQDGVFLIYKGRLEFANDAFARMVGYTVEELQNMDFNDIVSPRDLEKVESRYYKRQQREDTPAEYEFRMVHKNGHDVLVNIHVGLVNYQDGVASIGTLKDISERKHAEQEKRELEEKLARLEKMEAIGRLAGGVAHDLNNVLSAIVGYPDLLLMKLPGNSPLRKSITAIKQSGQKAAAIVQDLLTLARRGVTIKEIENLNGIISDYLNSPEFEKLGKHHPHVRVKTQFEKKLLNIKGSYIHLSKTIMNLVSNAVEAMPSGGEVLISTGNRSIDTRLRGYYQTVEKGEYVVLSVSDNGMGIAPGDLDKIFDPFYTKKEMGRSGTGLGMSVVWGTVEDHKGFIDVSSIEGKGTTFKLYFPVTTEVNFNHQMDVSIKEYMGNGEKILVVDDDFEQRKIAGDLLRELGYSVHTVASGEEAIDYMKTASADLLLLDMLMAPGLDGLDTYREILKLQPGVKAIIISGFSESNRVKKALGLGAGCYIKKPYTLQKIGMAINRELGRG